MTLIPLAMFGTGVITLFVLLLVIAVVIYVIYLLAKSAKNTEPKP